MSRPLIEINDLLTKGARAHGDKHALVWGDQRISYAELDDLTARFQGALQEWGVGPGDRVALLGRNKIDYCVALLSVFRSPCVLTPLNWRLSEGQVAEMCDLYEPTVLLYTEEFADTARAVVARTGVARAGCLDLGSSESVYSIGNASAPQVVSHDRDDLYAIISTGGTEGASKGVEVTHGAVEASTINWMSVMGPTRDDVFIVLPQMFHNPHLYMVPYLFVGATVVIPDMNAFDVEVVLDALEQERVTHALVVATMVNYLLASPSLPTRDLTALRLLAYGGAPFSATTLRAAMDALDCGFVQLYGQTEVSVLISTLSPDEHRRALASAEEAHLLSSCGRDVPLTDVELRDSDTGERVDEDGVAVGEVAARGPSVMRGYWRNEALTATTLEDGWCRTGDLATRDSRGFISIVDRKKEMIISGGENIFPRLVEEVLYQHPSVHEVAVVGVPDATWGEAVKAVVVLKDDAQVVTEAEMIEFCRGRIASYMKPRTVEFVDGLPKNPSGKIAKGELRQQYWTSEGRAVGGV